MIRKKGSLDYHVQGRKGKIEFQRTKPCLTQRDSSLLYSPGAVEPWCRACKSKEGREPVLDYTATEAIGPIVVGLRNPAHVLQQKIGKEGHR